MLDVFLPGKNLSRLQSPPEREGKDAFMRAGNREDWLPGAGASSGEQGKGTPAGGLWGRVAERSISADEGGIGQ